jgi:putative Holliday junction resolvase
MVVQGKRAAEGTVLAIDYGERRLGVAVGELSLGIARPLTTIAAGSDRARLEALQSVIREWEPVLVIVGEPAHLDDRPHPLAERCRAFADKLSRRFGVEVQMVDERLTSAVAESELAQAGVRAQRRREVVDQVAAQVILETYLTTHEPVA